MPDPTWIFRAVPPDGGRTGGDPAAMNFRRDLGSFAREVLQNSLDARDPEAKGPVRVRFVLSELTGARKRRFLEAAGFDRLAPHLKAASRSSAILGEGVARARDPAAPLRTLLVADFGTTGLTGAEKGRGRYASLVRHKLVSEKGDASAAGSFGLGKSVLWMFSGWSTVFVRSLPRPDRETPQDRIIGVAQLPSHEVPRGKERGAFDGPGWFGEEANDETGRFARSFPIEAERAEALGLVRDREEGTGTSILLADFLGDEESDEFDVEGCRKALEAAALSYFWPALCADPPRLRVEVVTPDGPRPVSPWRDEEVRVFAHLAGLREDRRLAGATREVELPLSLPSTKPLSEEEAAELGGAAEAALLEHRKYEVARAIRVRAAPQGDAGGEDAAIAKLALLRGSGMVVRYEEFAAPRPARAVALAGLARGRTLDDRRVERFLRTAEPPRHDDWTADAPYLPERYRSGYKGVLRGLRKRLQEAVLALLREETDAVREEVPRALLRVLRFRIPRGPARPKAAALRFGVEEVEEVERDGAPPSWWIRGWLEAEGEGALALKVDPAIAGEGGRVTVAVERFEADGTEASPAGGGVFVLERHGRFPFAALVRLSERELADDESARRLARLAALSLRLVRVRAGEAPAARGTP